METDAEAIPHWGIDIIERLSKLQNFALKLDTLESIDEKLTAIASGNTKIIEDVGKLTDRCTNLEVENTDVRDRLDKAEEKIDTLVKHCGKLDKVVEKLTRDNTWQEGIIKKINLVISGIEEKFDVEHGSCLGAVQKIVLQKYMKINIERVTIINCNRMGPPPPQVENAARDKYAWCSTQWPTGTLSGNRRRISRAQRYSYLKTMHVR